MNKDEIKATLERAVEETHRKYDNFQGVCIFGTFITDKADPTDVDIIPVLRIYGGDWYFKPEWEEDIVDDHPDYHKWLEVCEYFLSYFVHLPKGDEEIRSGSIVRNALIHDGAGIVALDDLPQLKQHLSYHNIDSKNFIGTEEAREIIKKILEE